MKMRGGGPRVCAVWGQCRKWRSSTPNLGNNATSGQQRGRVGRRGAGWRAQAHEERKVRPMYSNRANGGRRGTRMEVLRGATLSRQLVATRLDERRNDLFVSTRNRQQDEDLRTLAVVLSLFPTTAEAQLEWCRLRGKSRASFFRYKRTLEEQQVSAQTC